MCRHGERRTLGIVIHDHDPRPRRRPGLGVLRTVVLDIGGPTALYYVLHANGVSDVLALSIGAVPVVLGAGYQALRGRKPDVLGMVVLATMALGLLTAVISDGPRELLVRNAWLSLPSGVWTLLSLRSAQPLCFRVTRIVLPHKTALMDQLFATDRRFRVAFRKITVMWGVVLLLDCLLRIVMSYTLPVPAVPALDTALTVVTIVALQIPTHYFLWRSGSWQRLFGGRHPNGSRSAPAGQDSGTPALSSASHTAADESDGARQSPRGDNDPPAETFGPFGSADRLN
jgi:hypothetical protein